MPSDLLINEPPIVFSPSLAKMIGVNEAIVVQQLHFLLSLKTSGVMALGEKWIWNTYEGWQADYFPFWSTRTIRRIFDELETKFVVISSQPEGFKSRKKYYRLNKGMVHQLTLENASRIDIEKIENLPCGQNGQLEPPCGQVGRFDVANLADSHKYTETSTENPLPPEGVVVEDDTPFIDPDSKPTKRKPRKHIAEQFRLSIDTTPDWVGLIPEGLNTPEFISSWQRYIDYRAERKIKKLTTSSILTQFKRLALFGPDQSCKAIDQSIANGWQGIFPQSEKDERRQTGQPNSRNIGHNSVATYANYKPKRQAQTGT